jgi:hypothetical protein
MICWLYKKLLTHHHQGFMLVGLLLLLSTKETIFTAAGRNTTSPSTSIKPSDFS